ncbi:hypothetical protein BS47DRAFT_1144027 [Hydnum rufescens UP504]|uniref:Uncharacterized protein n=1 Tax=Hydnum rufescens UP504 TaxID=1448309 RepID=A0A9P6ATK9_9AGAM|nr:hypothetical protein BS47DRAFT_1144027 [Hydnum rufescens UP504]
MTFSNHSSFTTPYRNRLLTLGRWIVGPASKPLLSPLILGWVRIFGLGFFFQYHATPSEHFRDSTIAAFSTSCSQLRRYRANDMNAYQSKNIRSRCMAVTQFYVWMTDFRGSGRIQKGIQWSFARGGPERSGRRMQMNQCKQCLLHRGVKQGKTLSGGQCEVF